MIQFFRNLRIHSTSFWIGFFAATLLWWVLRVLRPIFKKSWEFIKKGLGSTQKGKMGIIEYRFRSDIFQFAQGLHITANLFSLDEILITPRLMAPPIPFEIDIAPPYEEVVSTLIPYTPDWPEMAAAYDAHTLDVFEALNVNGRIALIGVQGSGKTTTLAYIASIISRQHPQARDLINYIPLLFNITDIDLTALDKKDPLAVIIDGVSSQVSKKTRRRLPDMVRNALEKSNAILLLDGLDELKTDAITKVVNFLDLLLLKYPDTRIVVAADANHFDRLPQIGIVPISVSFWGRKHQLIFLQQWGKLWEKFISRNKKSTRIKSVDPRLINGWLLNMNAAVSPMDFTLCVWAAYSGDTRGPKRLDVFEAFIRRMSVNVPTTRIAMEILASSMILNFTLFVTENKAKEWISDKLSRLKDYESALKDEPSFNKKILRDINIPRALKEAKRTGIIIQRPNLKIGFAHPAIVGYLAGTSLTQNNQNPIFSQELWPLKNAVITSLRNFPELGHQIKKMLRGTDDPLVFDQMVLGRWLPNISKDIPERNTILKKFSHDLENEMLPMGIRIKVVTALANSCDPGIPALFRSLLNSENPNTRQLAVLGCGYLRDVKSILELTNIFGDVTKVSQAACFALVNIGTKQALESVASALIRGDNQLRRAAAEAFSSHPGEGYPILKDGSTVEDFMTRRAIIYGLRKVNQPWATQILETLQVDDDQWAIKDAASQAIDDIMHTDPAIPKITSPLENLPWLIAFAGEREVGIGKGRLAFDMLIRVLEEGNHNEILAALSQIQLRGETEIFPILYTHYYGENHEIREAAYNTMWQIFAMGIEIPPLSHIG